MTDENIELISNNDDLVQDRADDPLQNKRRPSVAWTEEAKPPTERETQPPTEREPQPPTEREPQPLDTKKILVD